MVGVTLLGAGVTLLELWCGHLWDDGEEDEELAEVRPGLGLVLVLRLGLWLGHRLG